MQQSKGHRKHNTMPPKCKSTIRKTASQTLAARGRKQTSSEKGRKVSCSKTVTKTKHKTVKKQAKQVAKNLGQPVQERSINVSTLGVPSTSIDTVVPVPYSEDDTCASDRAPTGGKHTHCLVEQKKTTNISADGESHVIDLSHEQARMTSHETPGSFNRVSTIDIAALGAALQTIEPNGSMPVSSSEVTLAGKDTSGMPTVENVGLPSTSMSVSGPEPLQTQQDSGENLTNVILLQMQNTLVSQVSENRRILQQLQQRITNQGSQGVTIEAENSPDPVSTTRDIGLQQSELYEPNQQASAIEPTRPPANKDRVIQIANAGTNRHTEALNSGDQMIQAQDSDQRGSGLFPLYITQHPEPHNRENGPGCSVVSEGVEPSNQSRRGNGTGAIPIAAKLLPPFTGEKEEKWEVWFARFEAIAMAHNWTQAECLATLLPLLRGPAGEFVYGTVKRNIRNDYQALVQELTIHYRKVESRKSYINKWSSLKQGPHQTDEELAAHIKEVYEKAYPERDGDTRKEDLVGKFLEALYDNNARAAVEFTKSPENIDEAVEFVVQYEETRKRKADDPQGRMWIVQTVYNDYDSDEDSPSKWRSEDDVGASGKTDEEINSGNRPPQKKRCAKHDDNPMKEDPKGNNPLWVGKVSGNSQGQDTKQCYKCGSSEHLIQDCPKKLQCYRCQGYGHKIEVCPTNPRTQIQRGQRGNARQPQVSQTTDKRRETSVPTQTINQVVQTAKTTGATETSKPRNSSKN